MDMVRTNDIEETASEWLIRRDSERWDEADEARLALWLAASTHHRVEFLRLELAWEESARLKALGAGIPGDRPPPPGQWNFSTLFFSRHPNKQPRRLGRIAQAAGVLIVVAAGMLAYQLPKARGEQFTTSIGGLAKVPTLDGSKLTLNTDSQVKVALSQNERHIDLQQGEAFFEVAKDPNRPFVVVAGGKRVIAVGTKFSVRNEGGAVVVVVTEGKVRMEDAGDAASVYLTAGAIAVSNGSGVSVQHKSLEEAELRLSWRDGVLTFRDLSLGEAVSEFNRYNVRKIVVTDPAVAALRVEGNFRPDNVRAFVRLLESGFPVRASIDDDRIVLASK